jgi:hypothetical protein
VKYLIFFALVLTVLGQQQELPYDTVDCDNANGNPKLCTVEGDDPDNYGMPHGKTDAENSIYFTSEGLPYQCGPMSYYGAVCWQPDGVPHSPRPVKGFMWMLVPEGKAK